MNAKQNHPHTAPMLLSPSDAPGSRAVQKPDTDDRPLHLCPNCSSDAVQPHDWIELAHSWEMTLECPNCGWVESGTYGTDQVERFEDHLEASARDLNDDLEQLTNANMLQEIDRFAAALASDLICPEDF